MEDPVSTEKGEYSPPARQNTVIDEEVTPEATEMQQLTSGAISFILKQKLSGLDEYDGS
jgi:hypothetical protein